MLPLDRAFQNGTASVLKQELVCTPSKQITQQQNNMNKTWQSLLASAEWIVFCFGCCWQCWRLAWIRCFQDQRLCVHTRGNFGHLALLSLGGVGELWHGLSSPGIFHSTAMPAQEPGLGDKTVVRQCDGGKAYTLLVVSVVTAHCETESRRFSNIRQVQTCPSLQKAKRGEEKRRGRS